MFGEAIPIFGDMPFWVFKSRESLHILLDKLFQK
jgi:hypothetical protein